jgi:crossover junction endodeoxyribonuclease RuvC
VGTVSVVVGLDLSLTATGVAVPSGVRTLPSRGKADANLAERCARLTQLRLRVDMALAELTPPGLVVLEAPSYGSSNGHQHDRSGLWWGVVSWLLQSGVPVAEVPPALVKKYATGKGNATKDEVLAAVVRRYSDVEVRNNNEADALVLRAMGCDWLGQPLADVPKANRDALAKVAWPEGLGRAA